MKYDTEYEVTDAQIQLCVAAWLMYGETFTDAQRAYVADLYAGGFKGFSSDRIGVIRLLGRETWGVTDKGKKMLEDV